MTTVMAWAAVDQRGPASVYVATDSRITWGSAGVAWDQGRKAYASIDRPDIFAYVGDVLMPSLVLPTVTDLVGRLGDVATLAEHLERVGDLVARAAAGIPASRRGDATIIHCTRFGDGMACEFGVQVLRLVGDVWSRTVLDLPPVSGALELAGSGSSAAQQAYDRWAPMKSADDRSRTSRAVFGAFCEALAAREDPRSGGAPQLVGLYRKGNGQLFGVRWEGATYLAGVPVKQGESPVVECRNALFERVDVFGVRLAGAQRHAGRR